MRILQFTQWFQPEPAFKGLPFAKALMARGFEVEALTGFPNYPGGRLYPGYRIKFWQREMRDGVRIVRTPLFPSHDGSGIRRMLNYISFAIGAALFGPLLVRKPDAIYIYNLVTLVAVAKWFKLLWRCRLILDVQDLWPESVLNSGMLPNQFLQRLLIRVCDRLYRSVDEIAVLSPGFKQALIDRGVPAERIQVIYNWTHESTGASPGSEPQLPELMGAKNRFVLMFAGTMGVMQGLDAVLDAANRCLTEFPAAYFVFIGGGIEAGRLKARAKAEGLHNVTFLPAKPPAEIGRYYRIADALLVHLKDDPLFRITIPSKTQAYLHAGKPILMAVRGDAADLVLQSMSGVVCEPGDAAGLVAAVRTLGELTPAEREAMGARGAAFYAKQMSLSAGTDAFAKLLVRNTSVA